MLPSTFRQPAPGSGAPWLHDRFVSVACAGKAAVALREDGMLFACSASAHSADGSGLDSGQEAVVRPCVRGPPGWRA